jgi:hypothetical protein
MAIILDKAGGIYRPFSFDSEKQFEAKVVELADRIFGPSSIYVDVKKRIKGSDIVSIPDGYVIDMAQPSAPRLFVVENEIGTHDAFKHIGIQMLKFVVGFQEAQLAIRQFLMTEISNQPMHLARLEEGSRNSGSRNIDAYLDRAVYSDFRGVVIVDERRPDLNRVIETINANISVIELKTYCAENGDLIHEFDTLYDEDEEEISVEQDLSTLPSSFKTDSRKDKVARRAASDTVIVPARKGGFDRVFLAQNQWYAIRISPAMKDRLKYIAAYQVAPVSAVTHIAEIEDIRPYQDSGKYIVKFKGPAKPIGPIGPGKLKYTFQGPTYVQREKLIKAKTLEDVLTIWRKGPSSR